MIQQQVVEYAKTQLALGIGEEVIKNALVDAGWPVSDVDDSIKSVAQRKAPEVVSAIPSAMASRQSTSPGSSSSQPINLKDIFGGAAKGNISFSAPADTSKADSSKADSSKTNISKTPSAPADISSLKKSAAEKFSSQKSSGGSKTVLIITIVIALAAIGAAVFFFINNRNLAAQVDKFAADNAAAGSAASGLSAQIADLTKSKQDADDQIASLTEQKDQLRTELLFFVPQPLALGATSSVISFSLSGTVGFDSKLQYTLTSDGIILNIKNSKDPKVDSILKPLIGKIAEISGTHAQLSRDVIVSAVNGAAL